MGAGTDADTDYFQRTGIPSGGAGTLSDGAFTDSFAGVWVYRDSGTATYNTTSTGSIIHYQSGAREVKIGYDNTFGGGTAGDPLLQALFNSGGGAGSVQTFGSANFLDEWVYYFIVENSTDGQIIGYIRLSDLATAVTITRANDNAGSQYINTLTFGNESGGTVGVSGWYAYARAVYGTGMDETTALTYAASDTTETGDWGFWPLVDNADTGDDSGNGRTLTFGGTISSESSPTLGGGGVPVAVLAMLHNRLRRV
jgi:hypothetical protein